MRLCLLLLPFLLTSCGREAKPDFTHPTMVVPDGGSVTLRVSNQSFAHDNIDIAISIDGELIISSRYPVKNQHHYVTYNLALDDGEHHILVESTRKGVSKEMTLELSKGKHIDVSYWYYPSSHYNPVDPSFRIRVNDHIPGIR